MNKIILLLFFFFARAGYQGDEMGSGEGGFAFNEALCYAVFFFTFFALDFLFFC